MTGRKTWRERNPEAYREAWRRWYRANARRKVAWQERRRDEVRRWWLELKSTRSCEDCGETAPECLHFHHVNPGEKAITLADAIERNWSKARIMSEVAKCRVLCANCHLKHHWEERYGL